MFNYFLKILSKDYTLDEIRKICPIGKLSNQNLIKFYLTESRIQTKY
jgi:hypothetical protein